MDTQNVYKCVIEGNSCTTTAVTVLGLLRRWRNETAVLSHPVPRCYPKAVFLFRIPFIVTLVFTVKLLVLRVCNHFVFASTEEIANSLCKLVTIFPRIIEIGLI